ncbi:MAG: hypothetical protein CMM59_19945 [Rhodospirillaceae bacterium]|nr:hypothetical protein [Rhodospirillaceae bacterium]
MTRDVVFILPSFAGGGAERVLVTLANGLNRDAFRPQILVLNPTGPLQGLINPEISVTSLECSRVRDALWALRRTIRGLSPDCVVSTMGYFNFAVLAACRPGMGRSRFFVREANEPDVTVNAIRVPMLAWTLYRFLYPWADTVICPSQRIHQELGQRFGIPEDRLSILHNPVDVEKIREAAARDMVRRDASVRFVGSGRLTEQKGFDRLLDMFAALPENARLVILGEGPDKEALLGQAAALGVSERVELVGFRENPWAYYASADAFLLPSRWEGMPNAALEALACGTPVIATPEAGGIAEVAALSAPNAVRLVATGDEFIEAMMRVDPIPIAAPRSSLLPESFSLDAVNAAFDALLTQPRK